MQSKFTTCMLVDEAIIGVSLSDRISVPSKRTLTDAGQMHVPCKFARTGTQLYTAAQLNLDGVDPKKLITVYRDEADVFDAASMDTFRSAPVTIGHPKDAAGKPMALTSENSKELQVGMLEGMPTRDEDTLGGVLILTAQDAIDALEDGTQELSVGYTCDIEEVDGKYYQRNIRANHIAIVAKGRAGSSCRISDEAEVYLGDHLEVVLADMAALQVTVDELTAKHDAANTALEVAKTDNEKVDIKLVKVEAELVDAKLAASEGVIERCEAIENARLIADMRDLGDKSVAEIKKMVVVDQMPDKKFDGKSEAYFDAMFEILMDQAKGETPMSKIMKEQAAHVVIDAKHVDPVAEARKKMIARQKGKKPASKKSY